jgi:hypothetical protein
MNTEQTKNPDKWTIKDFVYLTKDEKTLDAILWKFAFENDNNIRGLCNELGWNGGTIHQIKDEIIKRKEAIKKERPDIWENIESGKMKLIKQTFSL